MHEVNVEIHKVAWPTRAELVQHAWLCATFLVLLGGLLAGLDAAIGNLLRFLTAGG